MVGGSKEHAWDAYKVFVKMPMRNGDVVIMIPHPFVLYLVELITTILQT